MPKYEPALLARRADRIRKEKGLTIEDIALKTQLNKNTIVRFFKGEGTRIENAFSICDVLGVSAEKMLQDDLIEGEDYAVRKYVPLATPIGSEEIDMEYAARAERIPYTNENGLTIYDLHSRLPGGSLNAVVTVVRDKGAVFSHDGEEIIFSLTGDIGVRFRDKDIHLMKGDALILWSSYEHQLYNMNPDREKPPAALSIWVDPNVNVEKLIRGTLEHIDIS